MKRPLLSGFVAASLLIVTASFAWAGVGTARRAGEAVTAPEVWQPPLAQLAAVGTSRRRAACNNIVLLVAEAKKAAAPTPKPGNGGQLPQRQIGISCYDYCEEGGGAGEHGGLSNCYKWCHDSGLRMKDPRPR